MGRQQDNDRLVVAIETLIAAAATSPGYMDPALRAAVDRAAEAVRLMPALLDALTDVLEANDHPGEGSWVVWKTARELVPQVRRTVPSQSMGG